MKAEGLLLLFWVFSCPVLNQSVWPRCCQPLLTQVQASEASLNGARSPSLALPLAPPGAAQ